MMFAALNAAQSGGRLNLFLILFLVLFIPLAGIGQENLYYETFEGKAAEGVEGACSGMDRSTCATDIMAANGQWSLTGDFSGLAANGYLITNGAALRGERLIEELCFLSSEFDVSGYTDIDLSADLREIGTMEVSDYVDVSYILDGVETRVENFMNNGSIDHTLVDDWMSQIVTQDIADGTTLQIQICMLNAAVGERFDINEVKVTGVEKAAEPIPTMSQWSLFILALMFSSVGLVFLGQRELVKD